MTSPKWIVDVVDDAATLWWEFGVGEALEPEEALRNHVDNAQFDTAYDALTNIVRHHDGLAACLLRYRDGWFSMGSVRDGKRERRWAHPIDAEQPMSEAEQAALEWLKGTA